jgi:hypothetical protein
MEYVQTAHSHAPIAQDLILAPPALPVIYSLQVAHAFPDRTAQVDTIYMVNSVSLAAPATTITSPTEPVTTFHAEQTTLWVQTCFVTLPAHPDT